MKQETDIQPQSIYGALAAAQKAMGKALKDKNNPAFKSKYADLSSVMDACMGALNDNGFAVFQPTVEVDGHRYVRTIFAYVTGDKLECDVPLIVAKNDMQGFGSAVTYARRYGLMCMAGIAPEDDDGNAAAKAAPAIEEAAPRRAIPHDAVEQACAILRGADSLADLQRLWTNLPNDVRAVHAVIGAKDAAKARLNPPITDDEIPY